MPVMRYSNLTTTSNLTVNISKPVIRLKYLFKSLCTTIIFVIFLCKNIYFGFLLTSQGVIWRITQVTFSAQGKLMCTSCSDTNTNIVLVAAPPLLLTTGAEGDLSVTLTPCRRFGWELRLVMLPLCLSAAQHILQIAFLELTISFIKAKVSPNTRLVSDQRVCLFFIHAYFLSDRLWFQACSLVLCSPCLQLAWDETLAELANGGHGDKNGNKHLVLLGPWCNHIVNGHTDVPIQNGESYHPYCF